MKTKIDILKISEINKSSKKQKKCMFWLELK